MLIIIVKAGVDGMKLGQGFASFGNDDVMRMLSVRDWVAGQGWYDVAQYRLLPPEGVPLHWSRYIDVGIAALIVPFSLIFPMDVAEMVAATLWPTLIMIIHVLAVAFGTQRVFGRVPACFAVLCVTLWPLTADLHSRAGQLDHHNVQLLMMVFLAFAAIWPSRPVGAGVVGGIAAAFSLAVGLEALPFIVGGGLAIFMRAIFLPSLQTRILLFTFCTTLCFGSILLWTGQTLPAMWMQQACDRLGVQTLSLVAIAVVATVLPTLAHRRLKDAWMQMGAAVVLTCIGVVVAWPVLSGCLAGPYGALPEIIQEAIRNDITEAKPVFVYAQSHLTLTLVFMLPVIVSFLAGSILWLSSCISPRPQDDQNHALGILLIFCTVGILMVFVQMRTVIILASVVPVIGGVVVWRLLNSYFEKRDLTQGLLAIAVAAMIVTPVQALSPLGPLLVQDTSETRVSRINCLEQASLTALNDVPPGVILTHLNFGPGLIWATHHDGLSAPYHRSAAAMSNGILPFRMESAEMADYVRATPATHLLICRGYNYEGDFADTLANGGSADWLRPVPLDDDIQILFEVLRE
ncbi:hypothetical protein [Yoonia maricola]|nr:hypothetical protein [Yoonia maricola]